MGGVNDRGGKPTKKFDSTELARLTKPTAKELDDADEAFREWNEEAEGTPHAAHGTPHAHAKPIQPSLQPQASRVAAGTSPPGDLTRSRTATVHDPFTTGLLAEVARRTQTAELSPDQVRNAQDADATEDDEHDDDKTPPVVSPRIIKR